MGEIKTVHRHNEIQLRHVKAWNPMVGNIMDGTRDNHVNGTSLNQASSTCVTSTLGSGKRDIFRGIKKNHKIIFAKSFEYDHISRIFK